MVKLSRQALLKSSNQQRSSSYRQRPLFVWLLWTVLLVSGFGGASIFYYYSFGEGGNGGGDAASSYLLSLDPFGFASQTTSSTGPGGWSSSSLSLRSSYSKKAVDLLRQPLPADKVKVHKLEGVSLLEKSETTVVVSHFRVASNPPSDTFYAYVSHLLTVKDNMIIFTETSMVDRMLLLRSIWPNRTVVVELVGGEGAGGEGATPAADLLPVSRLVGGTSVQGKKNPRWFWSDQLQMDPLREERQSYEFYWPLLSKSYLVNQVIDNYNYFDSDFFLYTDIDLFRTKKFLNKRIVQKPNIVPNGALLWMARSVPDPPSDPITVPQQQQHVQQHQNSDTDRESGIDVDDPHSYHIATMGAGRAGAWKRYHEAFAQTLDAFAERGLFVGGNDERIAQSACQLHLDACSYVLTKAVADLDPSARKAGLRTVLQKGGMNFKQYKGRKPGYDRGVDDDESNSDKNAKTKTKKRKSRG